VAVGAGGGEGGSIAERWGWRISSSRQVAGQGVSMRHHECWLRLCSHNVFFMHLQRWHD
jgi:hypothetical protein